MKWPQRVCFCSQHVLSIFKKARRSLARTRAKAGAEDQYGGSNPEGVRQRLEDALKRTKIYWHPFLGMRCILLLSNNMSARPNPPLSHEYQTPPNPSKYGLSSIPGGNHPHPPTPKDIRTLKTHHSSPRSVPEPEAGAT